MHVLIKCAVSLAAYLALVSVIGHWLRIRAAATAQEAQSCN